MRNKINEIVCIIFSFEEIKLLAKLLIIIPKITGNVTTKNIFVDIPTIEISFVLADAFKKSIDLKIIKGTVIILNKLITAVRDMERATSPFANLVKILEVTPPGAAAIIIKPTANSTGTSNMNTKAKAIIGKKTNWQTRPTIKSLGCFITLVKSCMVNPIPRANIIKANDIGAIFITISILRHFNLLYTHLKLYIKKNNKNALK